MVRTMKAACASLFILLVAAGCAGSKEEVVKPERPLRIETIKLVMEQGTNDNSPVRVDLVRVPDVSLIDELSGVETKAWFAARRDVFKSAHPEALFDEWEPVPGEVIGPQDVEHDGDMAGVLFCGVEGSSAPIRLERDGDVVVHISDEGCEVSGGAPSKKPTGPGELIGAMKGGVKKGVDMILDLLPGD